MNDTPSNAVKKLNTVIVKFINNHIINDIIECFNENSNDLYDYIYDHTPSADDYFRYLTEELITLSQTVQDADALSKEKDKLILLAEEVVTAISSLFSTF